MTKGEAWADLDRLFRGKNGLFRCIGVDAADVQRVVRIGILLVEPNRLQGCIQAFPDILFRFVAPAVSDDAGAHPAEPEMRLCEFRIEPACLPEQLAGTQVSLTADVVEMPGTLPHQVPGRRISAAACSSWKRFRLE